MKGIIFKILEATVTEHFGDEVWDKTLENAGLAGAYTSLGNYDDAEVVALLNELPSTTGNALSERLRWFGRHSIPSLQQSFPQFFEGHDLRSILPTLNHVIHPEVRKLYPGANPPVFELDEQQNVHLIYRSERKLCHLAEGFILGTADALKEEVSVRQTTCMLHGDDHCDIELSWS